MSTLNAQLVLGNGFDVYLKLPTKYDDFFSYQKIFNSDYCSFREMLNYSEFDPDLSIIRIPDSEFDSVIHKLTSHFSLWDAYFLLLDWFYEVDPNNENGFGGGKNWSDVETQISNFLSPSSSITDLTLSNVMEEYTKKVGIQHIRLNTPIGKGCNLNYFLALFLYFRLDEEMRFKIGSHNCFDFALKELKIFERNFSDYIIQCETKNEFYSIESTKFINSLINGPFEKITVESFNFTKMVLNENWYYRNVHGIASSDMSGIFGIETLSNKKRIVSTDDQYIFSKTSRELELEINGNAGPDAFRRPHVLIIFGHSLNKQDEGYFFDLFDTMGLDDSGETSIVVFDFCLYDKCQEAKIKADRLTEATNLINRYEQWKIASQPALQNQGSLLSRLLHTGRIQFRQIPRYGEKGAFNDPSKQN